MLDLAKAGVPAVLVPRRDSLKLLMCQGVYPQDFGEICLVAGLFFGENSKGVWFEPWHVGCAEDPRDPLSVPRIVLIRWNRLSDVQLFRQFQTLEELWEGYLAKFGVQDPPDAPFRRVPQREERPPGISR